MNSTIAERPQHMLMRVAVGIHGSNIDDAIETYNLLSEKWFTHATPTLFNAGNVHRPFDPTSFDHMSVQERPKLKWRRATC